MTNSTSTPLVRGRSRFRLVTAIAMVLALVAGACGSDGSDDAASEEEASVEESSSGSQESSADTQASSEDSEEPSEDDAMEERTIGGSAVAIASGLSTTLDPSLQRVSIAFTESAIMGSIFGHLAMLNSKTGAVEMYFLESLEPNDDGSVWTATLNDGIKFSDGTPLDAEAIRFNIARSADEETGSRFQPATEGLEMEVTDDLTIVFSLPTPNLSWNAYFVSNFAGVGSPTAIQAAIDAGEEVGQHPVGAGPFMVDDWDPGARLVLVRNPHFGDFMPGQPYLDELIFEKVDDLSQQVAAIETGAAQVALTFGGGPTEQLREAAQVHATPSGGGSSITLNVSVPPFDDIRARMALALALDRNIMADAFQPGTPASTSMFSETSPFYNEKFTWPEQDKEEAQRLLDELAAEGSPLHFSYTTFTTPQQTNVIDALNAQLAEFDNISFEPDIRTYSEYAEASISREFQSLAWGVYFTNPVPVLYDNFHPDGVLNYSVWENDAAREALDGLSTSFTVPEQKEIWDVVQRELLAEMPLVWLGETPLTVAYGNDMIVPKSINLGTSPLWGEVGYK